MYGHGFALKDKDGKTIYLQSYFSAVPVDVLTGPVEQQQIQVVTSYNSAKKRPVKKLPRNYRRASRIRIGILEAKFVAS